MIDLTKVSGLPIEVADDYKLKLKDDSLESGDSSARTFSEMVPVLYDKNAKSAIDEMYYMNRDIRRKEDRSKIENYHVRYDVTVVPAAMIGDEYNKTVGHYHANIPGSNIAHPEMYEVLNGKALFLLQKMDDEMKNVLTILAVEAKTGDKVIYPPNYGHIIVNIGEDTLVTANWVSSDTKSEYEPIKERAGMAIYVVKGKDGKPAFVKNENYKDQPELHMMNMSDKLKSDFGIEPTEPMYVTGMRNPELLDFLNHPAKYAVQLSALSS